MGAFGVFPLEVIRKIGECVGTREDLAAMSATCKSLLTALFPTCLFSKRVLRISETTVFEAKKGRSSEPFDKVVVHEGAPSKLVARVLKSIDALGKPFSIFWYQLKWDAQYQKMGSLRNVYGVWAVNLQFSKLWQERAATAVFPNATVAFCNLTGFYEPDAHIFCKMFSVFDHSLTHHIIARLHTHGMKKSGTFGACPFSRNLFDSYITQNLASKNSDRARCSLCERFNSRHDWMWG